MWPLAVVLAVSSGAAKSDCLPYQGRHTLDGVVVRHTFAGPPNFEDVRRGDRAETYFVLRLKAKICVADDPTDKDGLNGGANDVGDLQLMLDQRKYAELRPLLGKPVRLSGTFMTAITGHHHTPIMLQDVRVEGRR